MLYLILIYVVAYFVYKQYLVSKYLGKDVSSTPAYTLRTHGLSDEQLKIYHTQVRPKLRFVFIVLLVATIVYFLV